MVTGEAAAVRTAAALLATGALLTAAVLLFTVAILSLLVPLSGLAGFSGVMGVLVVLIVALLDTALGIGLLEGLSLGGQKKNPELRSSLPGRSESRRNGVDLHDHAVTTSIRGVVGHLVFAFRPVTQIMQVDGKQAFVDSLAKNAGC